ncbi:hypothetical protein WA026_011488 [Henosepilachna vigintioctopunctata]|uniref:Secreted protein n=1 Tax=Henosepilachna vigintioctopunctata TaxID=420089 RepID=A0AAW1TJN6_9CUCU
MNSFSQRFFLLKEILIATLLQFLQFKAQFLRADIHLAHSPISTCRDSIQFALYQINFPLLLLTLRVQFPGLFLEWRNWLDGIYFQVMFLCIN